MIRRLRPERIAVFVIGVAIVAALAMHAGWSSVANVLGQLRLNGLALVAFIHLPIIVVMGLAWWVIGRRTAWAAPEPFIVARLVRDSVGEALPLTQVGGFAAGLRLLHLRGVDVEDGATSAFADLVAEFSAKVVYFIVGLAGLYIVSPGSRVPVSFWIAFGFTAAVVILGYVFRVKAQRAVHAAISAVPRHWLGPGNKNPLSIAWNRRIAVSAALHLVCWIAGGAETCIIFLLLGQPISMAEALIIDSLVSGLRTFGFLVPAAAGVQEAAYVLVSTLVGIPPATALAVSLVRRARDLVIGMPGLAVWLSTEQRNLSRSSLVSGPQAGPSADNQ